MSIPYERKPRDYILSHLPIIIEIKYAVLYNITMKPMNIMQNSVFFLLIMQEYYDYGYYASVLRYKC